MKTKLILFATLIIAISCLQSCKTATEISSDYALSSFKTSCLGVDLDGSQTLRAWGRGNNRADAIEQAKRNAVRDVIFNGITDGSGECNKRPLITEVNAQEKYEQYFNTFFASGGAYKQYVRLDEKRTSRIASKNDTMENYGVVVTIDRTALRTRLINDNIINP